MLDAKPCPTPSCTTKLETTTNSLMLDPTTYRSLVGALQYLTWTWPNIALAVNQAYWAGCPLDRRSTTGFCVFFGSNLISWCAKKQSIVACSSTESEYRALAQTAAEITWICSLLKNLYFFLHQPPMLLCDNISALALFANLIFH
ncbi:unnamed protein product, partial [Prunus brigantina]